MRPMPFVMTNGSVSRPSAAVPGMSALLQGHRLFGRGGALRYRAGIPWRDLPERFGDPIKIHTRFSRWAEAACGRRVRASGGDADNEYA